MKTIIHLLKLTFTVLTASVAGMSCEAAIVLFDFEPETGAITGPDSTAAGSVLGHTVTQLNTAAGETIVVTSGGTTPGLLYATEDFYAGSGAYTNASGNALWPSNLINYFTSITISLQSGNAFDLDSIFFGDFLSETDNIVLTTTKGTANILVEAYSNEDTAPLYDLTGEAALKGVTEVSFTSSTDGQFWVGIDNVTISNVVPEPTTYALVMSLFAALTILARRRMTGNG